MPDTFVITDTYIAGAGRIVNFIGVEAIEVDAGGGADQIYVLSTSASFTTTVAGGSATIRFTSAVIPRRNFSILRPSPTLLPRSGSPCRRRWFTAATGLTSAAFGRR